MSRYSLAVLANECVVLLKHLEAFDVTAHLHWVPGFCIQKMSMEMLRPNPFVLIMDCTYKTNKYKMPMLDIVGVNDLNKSFFVGFCFWAAEDESSYTFALEKLKEVYSFLELQDP